MTAPPPPVVEQPQGVTDAEILCSYCGGSGETMCSTSHLGPDDYDYQCSCDACNGTGSGDLAEVIKSLGYWKHKTDIERTLIERSAVLRIIEKFAKSRATHPSADLATPSPAQAEPTDAERLDFLDAMGAGWIARHSVTGRGYRLHQDRDGSHPTARAAIDAAIRAAQKG